MPFYLVVKTGSQAGLKVPLKEGFFIGRSKKSSLCLKDPSVSALHAKVIKKNNRWLLIDNNSFNGTKFKGKKITELFLSQNTCFQIGKNLIEVLEEKIYETSNPSSVIDFLDEKTISSFRLRSKSNKKTWQEKLLKLMESYNLSFKDQVHSIKIIKPTLTLQFIKGLQIGTHWKITYGPRQIGKKSIDLPIYDEEAPDLCFEIFPSPKGPTIKIPKSKKILLNGKPRSAKKIEEGDQLDFGKTTIKFSLHSPKTKTQ